MTAEEILEHMRALPTDERRKLLEEATREMQQGSQQPARVDNAIWADATDEEFEAFLKAIEQSRQEPWRSFE